MLVIVIILLLILFVTKTVRDALYCRLASHNFEPCSYMRDYDVREFLRRIKTESYFTAIGFYNSHVILVNQSHAHGVKAYLFFHGTMTQFKYFYKESACTLAKASSSLTYGQVSELKNREKVFPSWQTYPLDNLAHGVHWSDILFTIQDPQLKMQCNILNYHLNRQKRELVCYPH